MQIAASNKTFTREGNTKTAILECKIEEYTVYVFEGDLSPLDILIKYQTSASKLRTPKHIHWVADVLMKMQAKPRLTKAYLLEIQNYWNSCTGLTARNYTTLYALLNNGIDLAPYATLDNYGEYGIAFVDVLLKLLAVQEKTNRPDAYMFGNILTELLREPKDLFKILSTARFGGR